MSGRVLWVVFGGGLLYMGVVYLLWVSYAYQGMGYVNLLWSCLSIIFAMLVGILLFGEKVNVYTCLTLVSALLTVYLAFLANQ